MSADFNQLDNFFTSSPRKKNPRGFWFPSKEQLSYLPKVLSARERYTVVALVVLALVSLVMIPVAAYYGATNQAPAHGGSVTEGMIGAPQHINPLLLQANDVDSDLANIIYAGLLRYDAQGNLAPDLAGSYEVSDDGLKYTFTLRENLLWHDGNALTVEDVIFTILTAQNGDYGSTQRINWQGVEITKKDETKIVFTLKNRYAQFLNNATLGILPKHKWELVKPANFAISSLNLEPIGAGPYKVDKLRRDNNGMIQSMELSAFENYGSGNPYIKKLTFKFYDSEQKALDAYEQGEVEGVSFVSSQNIDDINLNDEDDVHNFKLPRYFALFFNQNKSKALSEALVRKALNHATDKTEILATTLSGHGTIVDSPLLPGIINIPDQGAAYPFDKEKASQLLDQGGWKVDPAKNNVRSNKDGTQLELEITTSSWPELLLVAEAIKKQWENLGIVVTIKTLSIPEIQQAIKDRNYTMLLFGEVLGLDPDPFSFWHSTQKRDPGLNLALYDNKDADGLLDEARQTLDIEKRRSLYDQFQKIVVADAPVVFLYSPDYLYLQPTKIKNNIAEIIAVPSNRFDTVHEWYIDTKRVKE